tara:strand:+ start:1760 stop:1900 length:141 start_codon:yes stop_codon:yes gene_type:complete
MPIVIRKIKNLKGRNDTKKRTPKNAPARGKTTGKKAGMMAKKKKKY